MYEIVIVLIMFLMVFTVFGIKYLQIIERKAQNQYKLDRKRLKTKLKNMKRDDDEGDEYEEFEESLPPWLKGIADGAGVNLEAVYDGDPEELKKVRDLLDKNLPAPAQGGESGGGYL